MAITRKTQKDIGNYEAKFLGAFTARNCIFLGLGSIPTVFAGYMMFASKTFDAVTIFSVCALIMSPFLYFGFAHPYGLKPENFLREYYIYHLAAPKIRKYETQTQIEAMKSPKPENTKNSKNEKNKTHKKDPDFPDFL